MKKISTQQIEALLTAFYQANAPVQMFESVKKLLAELPAYEEPKKE